jgi:hypothetical protein
MFAWRDSVKPRRTQDSQSPGRDSMSGPPKYETGLLITLLRLCEKSDQNLTADKIIYYCKLYVYVCMYVCTYVRTDARMYERTHVCMCVCVYVHMYVCVCVCVCGHAFMRACMHVCMCT